MGMASVTVSAKIPRRLKERLARYGLRVSEVVRGALEEEVARREEMELRESLNALSRTLKSKIHPDDVAEAVRSTREEK